MAERFFTGDLVETKYGVGRVVSATTWRDRLLEKEEYEVEEFCATCKALVGIDYQEKWIELVVSVGGRNIEVQAGTVKILEGRDHERGLENFAVKKSKNCARGEQGNDTGSSEKKSRKEKFSRFGKE
jgi:hypothetical protein